MPSAIGGWDRIERLGKLNKAVGLCIPLRLLLMLSQALKDRRDVWLP